MKWKVHLYVGGTTFYEEVQAVNRNDAIDTAKARNPKGKSNRSKTLIYHNECY